MYPNSYDVTTPPKSTSSSIISNPTVPAWEDNPCSLKEFASKRDIPGFAKIVKGSYMTLGSSKFSFSKQHHEVFIHSVKVGVKILAHCVKRVEGQSVLRRASNQVIARLYNIDQRLAVPITYQGWFELLSEDGKSARPLTSVHELSKVKPQKVLVRENIKCYIIEDEAKPTFDKTKIIIAGEQLRLKGEMSLPSSHENRKVKLLRCVDTYGDVLYLSFDQKGLFTIIAGEKDVTGVFNIRDIVQRFRLPLTVKLVQGVRPKVDHNRFTGLIRLDWVYTDETAFVCPIEKNHVRLLPVPLDTNLQLVAASNRQELTSSDLYNGMMAKCTRMIQNYNNTLHLIVQIPYAAAKSKNRQTNMFSASIGSNIESSPSTKSKQREKRLMDEIDDLYGYVRDGGAVPNGVKFSYDSDEESYWEEPAYEPLDEFRARLQALEAGKTVTYHEKYKPAVVAGSNDSSGKTMVEEPVYGTAWEMSQVKTSGSSSSKSSSTPPPVPPKPLDLVSRDDLVNINSPKNSKGVSTEKLSDIPPPLPPRRQSDITQPSTTAFPTTPHTAQGVTVVSNFGMVSSSKTSLLDLDDAQAEMTPKTLTRSTSTPQQKLGMSQHTPAKMFLQTSKSNADIGLHHQRDSFALSRSKNSLDSSTSGESSKSSNGQHRQLARDFKDSDISSVGAGDSASSSYDKKTKTMRRYVQTIYL